METTRKNHTEIKEYQEKNYDKYSQVFHETHAYQNIHMDARSHLFYIGEKIDKRLIL